MFRTLLLITMLGTTVLVGAGFAGALHPAFDTLSNFRAHLSGGLVVLAFLWSLRCSRVPAIAFALAGFLGIAASAPGLPLQPEIRTAAGHTTVHTAFVLNLRWNNQQKDAVITEIRRLDPDLVMVTEYSGQWARILDQFGKNYPVRMRCASNRNRGGAAIFSKLPLADGRSGFVEPCICGFYGSALIDDFTAGGKPFSLGMIHLRWPWPASGPELIDQLLPDLHALPEDALIAGDFNSVTWSHSVRRFAEAGALDVVGGIGPTWRPTLTISGRQLKWPFALGLPIDNVMEKGAVRVLRTERLDDLGSDHLPVWIEFTVE